ncbi:MAG: hypothetical protein Q9162_004447 [Coniocarpon cinnabarinum]
MAAALFLGPTAITAFSVTNCNTGAYHNYGESGNNKCQNFITGDSVRRLIAEMDVLRHPAMKEIETTEAKALEA